MLTVVWTGEKGSSTLHLKQGKRNPLADSLMENANFPVEIDVQSVKAMLGGNEQFVLLDCREQQEFDFVKLNGAQHIPMGEITGRLAELNGNQDDRIVVYCHHGGRSLMVAQFLRQQGFQGAQSMSGGIDAWAVEIDSTLPRY